MTLKYEQLDGWIADGGIRNTFYADVPFALGHILGSIVPTPTRDPCIHFTRLRRHRSHIASSNAGVMGKIQIWDP